MLNIFVNEIMILNIIVNRRKNMNMTGLGDGSEAKFLEAIKALPFMDTVRLFLSIIRYK